MVSDLTYKIQMKLPAGQFYGNTVRYTTVKGFSLTEKFYHKHKTLPRHCHELPHYCLVLEGSYQERLQKKEQARGASSLIYYPADISHSEKHLSDGRHFLIEMRDQAQEQMLAASLRLNEPVDLTRTFGRVMGLRLYKEFWEQDPFTSIVIEGLMLELLAETSRQVSSTKNDRPPHWLARVKEVLQDSGKLIPDMDTLAGIAGVHSVHLSRTFRRFEGCTVGEYARTLRINYSKTLLAESPDCLVSVALEAGFYDHSHFSRCFKKATGMTPAEYRSFVDTRKSFGSR